MTSPPVIGLFHDAWRTEAAAPNGIRRSLALWRKAVRYKANPRGSAYMRDLLEDRSPGAIFVDVDADPDWHHRLVPLGTVVLLYPDAIGLGFGAVECRLRRHHQTPSPIVLNGRRRQFARDRRTGLALSMRRFLEWTMLAECLVAPFILLATPILLAIDYGRGRR